MENQKVGAITLKNRIENLYTKVFNPAQLVSEEDNLIKMLQDAREEWQRAEARFQEVTDNDLIDHTIYDLQAAKTRYSYLLKIVKEKGIKCDFQ